MAFVVRSERKMDYFKKDSTNPGPGQYFQENDKKIIKKKIYPPFHISAQRTSINKKENTPGPGSYDLIDKSIINKDSLLNTIKINNINEEEKIRLNSINKKQEKKK